MLDQATIDLIADEYPDISGFPRFHLMKRLAWCPYDVIAQGIPSRGGHVDIGCGFGHLLAYLATTRPELTLAGSDPDERKIAVAQASRLGQSGRVKYVAGSHEALDIAPRSIASASIIDVLYLLDDDAQNSMLRWVTERLQPGGKLVIKTLDVDRGLKSRMAELQEFVMVGILRRTASSGTWLGSKPIAHYVAQLNGLGYDVDYERLSYTRTPALLINATLRP